MTDVIFLAIRKLKDLPIEDAVTYAIDECIADGILADFLRKNRREAIRVSVLECDVDKVMAYLQEEAKEIGYEEGFEEGFEKGKSEVFEKILESKIASIQALTKSLNMTIVQAMDVLNIPEEERELLSSRLEAQD